MRQWEHCSVFNNRVTFYRLTGVSALPIERDKAKGDRNDEDAYRRLIVELGADGWEYAGMNGLAQWFKRPVEG